MVGAAANSASIMRELNPVPFEQWHGPWSDCRQRRPVPSARGVKAVLGFVTLLSGVEMEPAGFAIQYKYTIEFLYAITRRAREGP